jgi:hypothetical protein
MQNLKPGKYKIMIKKIVFLFVVIFLIISGSCKKYYEVVPGEVVINELMPTNSTTVADQNGEYDDWIELFNLSYTSIDLSGYFLSDSKKDNKKWKLPQGTSIPENGYLIIWADKDTTEVGLHANFKLSSKGETVILSRPDGTITDRVEYPSQSQELSYSRRPNGRGAFIWQTPTFSKSNDSD